MDLLDVEIRNRQRVLFDELAPWFDLIAHQSREDIVRRDGVFDSHDHESTALRIDGRLPKLLGIHLAQAFVALTSGLCAPDRTATSSLP